MGPRGRGEIDANLNRVHPVWQAISDFSKPNGCLLAGSGTSIPDMTYSWKRPRLCENPNSKTQSGKSKPIHGLPIKYVEFMGLVKRYAESFIGCYPNFNEG